MTFEQASYYRRSEKNLEKVYTNLTTGGPISVYVEDGKITRIRPLQVPDEDWPKAWSVEDRHGKKYSPPNAVRIAQNILAERNSQLGLVALEIIGLQHFPEHNAGYILVRHFDTYSCLAGYGRFYPDAR
jgi:hypothetical protein